jgi:hypothetical protein
MRRVGADVNAVEFYPFECKQFNEALMNEG